MSDAADGLPVTASPAGRGAAEMGEAEMVRDLKAKVFPDRELKYVALGAGGKMEVRVV